MSENENNDLLIETEELLASFSTSSARVDSARVDSASVYFEAGRRAGRAELARRLRLVTTALAALLLVAVGVVWAHQAKALEATEGGRLAAGSIGEPAPGNGTSSAVVQDSDIRRYLEQRDLASRLGADALPLIDSDRELPVAHRGRLRAELLAEGTLP